MKDVSLFSPKKIFFGFCLLLLCVSLYTNYQQQKQISLIHSEPEPKHQPEQVSHIADRFTTKDSVKHVIYTEVYAKTNYEKSTATGGYVDSLAKALAISVSRIEELTRVKATIQDKVKLQINSDSLNSNRTYSYHGKWLTATVNPADTTLDYVYNLELINTRYRKGNWLTGRRWYNDVSLADPNALINSVERFTIPPERVRRLGLGLQVGYRYDFAQNKISPSIGLGLSYNFVRF